MPAQNPSTTKQFGLTGVAADLQLGKSGPRVIVNGGVVEAHDATNTSFTNIRAADGLTDDDVVTKRQLAAIANAAATNGMALTLGTPTDGSLTDGAIAFTTTDKVTDAIDRLNETLGLLVPAAPPSFPNTALTISNVGSSPVLASGATDNTNGGTLPAVAGASVTRVTSTTPSTNTITNNGPGDSGIVTAVINGTASGNHTMTTAVNNGTYGSLVIANNVDYGTISGQAQGFWKSFNASMTASSALSTGWNRYQITDTGAGNTNTAYFVVDSVTSTPTVTVGSLTENAAGTVAYSSGIKHYNTGGSLNAAGITMTNLAGQTYYNGAPLSVTGTNGVITTDSISYATAGISTPIAANTTTAQAVSTLVTNVDGTNVFNSGVIAVTGTNVNGSGSAASYSTTVLVKNGTQSARFYEETFSAPSGATSVGRVYLGSGASGDTPSSSLTGTPGVWVQTQDLTAAGYTHEAAVVAGVLSANRTNYTTGFLPAGLDYTGKPTTQYATFAFKVTPKSGITITLTGTYHGLWVGLPGVSDNATNSPNSLNGWWNALAPYNGSGYPGRAGDTTAGINTNGGVTGYPTSLVLTFGSGNTSAAANNYCFIRIRLDAGDSLTSMVVA